MKQVERFIDTGEHLSSFEDEVLVVCPKCAACAKQIRTREADVSTNRLARKLICASCGLTRKGGTLALPGTPQYVPPDLTLWLQTPCCGQTLWAFNLRHIETIESYVRASLREKHKYPTQGWSNTSFVNRLPKWIKAANNREEILKGIVRLKERLPS